MSQQLSYLEIANDLQMRIAQGEYAPGTMIPSYAGVAEAYDVSVATAYRAVSLLKDRGLVRGRPGRGTYVTPAP